MKLLLSNHLITFKSPILVVCYTNHALDQFLEGILAIMYSLQIDPYGKLVRVGGQSKVEDIQEYNIRKISRDYIAEKKFDTNYAQLRSRTRGELLLYQNYRADLKSLFTDLSNPEGIVNFSILNEQIDKDALTGLGLDSIFPDHLAVIFQKPTILFNWLQMHYHEFDSNRIPVERILQRWFRIDIIRIQEQQVNEEEETPEAEEHEDEELRSILIAHRMEEEIMEEDRKYKAARLEYYFHYKQEEKFTLRHNELWSEYEEAQQNRDYKKTKYLEGQMYELELQRNKFANQCKFMKELVRGYKDGRIDLPKVTPDLLNRANQGKLTISEKWAIYFHFIDEAKKYLIAEIIKKEAAIIEVQKKMMEVNNQGDGIILQQAQIVGMTTTGAAKYNTVLRMMKSKIVIVEEAAEVLESHIVTCITEHCQHLILIGDHQQLRPPTTVYKLAKEYQLDVSLFERLIKNNISWQYLRAQHRMRPEICKLLVPTIYRDLEDHSNVHFYPPVKGFVKNIFFVTHGNTEKVDNDSMTKSNEYEALYITQLCRHLMLQGYKSSQITILTTYIGQMFLIKKFKLNEGNTCRDVRVTVVDNFQGEENDIILLSLVKIQCHQLANPDKWICGADCDTRLACGHQCTRKCHLQDEPDHLNYRCMKNCARSCENDHQCRKKHLCHQPCDPCKVNTDKTLSCGHVINVQCSCNIEKWQCEEPCQKEILTCGHKCLKKCFQICDPCIVTEFI